MSVSSSRSWPAAQPQRLPPRELEVSPRTLARDLDFLRDEEHVPIAYEPAQHGYRLTDATYDLPPVNLSRREVFNFSLAREMLHAFEGTPLEMDMVGQADLVSSQRKSGRTACGGSTPNAARHPASRGKSAGLAEISLELLQGGRELRSDPVEFPQQKAELLPIVIEFEVVAGEVPELEQLQQVGTERVVDESGPDSRDVESHFLEERLMPAFTGKIVLKVL